MNRWTLCALPGAVLLIGTAAINAASAAEDDEGAIKYRQSVMKGVGGHTGAIYQIVKNSNPNQDHLEAHVRALSDLMGMIPGAFQQRTSGGETRAKAEIWSDAAGFERAARDAGSAARALGAAASAGDGAQIADKLDVLLDACKGCHREYREKKD